ncbi:MAG: transposase [Bacteroidales bacterium]|nr:transposase [Bacteroidales bacterium]MBD5211428.1 transposase [Bacteroidales bacterium]
MFYNAHVVNDRFHVQQIYNEAVDEIRIDIRRQLIAEDNNRGRSVPTPVYSKGETMRWILARSKHTLLMSQHEWTDTQRHRVNIRFRHYPILKSAYNLSMELRSIFNAKISPTKAMERMNKWYEKVMEFGNSNFRSVIRTFFTLYSICHQTNVIHH